MRVDQSLHGYSHGHRLLAGSVSLRKQEKLRMAVLSDLAGNGFRKGFERYFTGYFLEGEKCVLASTWYAPEMERPGCVWTHSLIFDRSDLKMLSNPGKTLLPLFVKPDMNEGLDKYREPVSLDSNETLNDSGWQRDDEKINYLIWCVFGTTEALMISEENSRAFENEMLYLFLEYNDFLDKDFVFCTGALSPRFVENKPMKIQMLPIDVVRTDIISGGLLYRARDFKQISEYPLWVRKTAEMMRRDKLSAFRAFRRCLPESVKQKEAFSSEIKLFIGSGADKKNLNLGTLMEYTEAIFHDDTIIADVWNAYQEGRFNEWGGESNFAAALFFWLRHAWLVFTEEDMCDFVRKCIATEPEKAVAVFDKALGMENESGCRILSAFAAMLKVEQYPVFTGMDLPRCCALVIREPSFAVAAENWTTDKHFQRRILEALQQTQKRFDYLEEIVCAVLCHSEYDYAGQLTYLFGKKSYCIFWNYYFQNPDEVSRKKGVVSVVMQDIDGIIGYLKKPYESIEKLWKLVHIIDSCYFPVIELSVKKWEWIYYRLSQGEIKNRELMDYLAVVFLPILLRIDGRFSEDLAKDVYNRCQRMLATQQFPEEVWKKMNRILPKLDQKHMWDRCRRLERAFKEKKYPVKEY